MWQIYVYNLLAGLVAANGVPHFIKGILGHKHQTPFGKSSSAYVNVAWGWLNFVVASLLIYYSHFHQHPLRAFACGAIGVLVGALFLASVWEKGAPVKK
jgi:hypothetical protein